MGYSEFGKELCVFYWFYGIVDNVFCRVVVKFGVY